MKTSTTVYILAIIATMFIGFPLTILAGNSLSKYWFPDTLITLTGLIAIKFALEHEKRTKALESRQPQEEKEEEQ